MADIRINSLPSTATSFNTDDYIAIDGASGGTRKMLAATLPLTDVTLGGSSGPSVKSTLSARAPRQGLVFDGTAGTTVSGVPAFGTGDFTVSAWIRVTSLAINNVIFDAANASTSAFALYIATDGSVRRLDRVAYSTVYTSSGVISVGKTYLVTYARGSIYVNGVSQLTFTDTSNYSSPIAQIGWAASNDSFCTGLLVPLIYNRALSASEVVSLYEAGAPAGADYPGTAAGTSLSTSAFSGTRWGASYSVFSGASATGFHAERASGGGDDSVTSDSFTVKKGDIIRCVFDMTNSADLPYIYLGDASTGAQKSTTLPQTTAGSAQVFLLTASAAGSVRVAFYTSNAQTANYTVANFTALPLGLLLAPDAAQAGGGLVWYDTSGNGANISWTSGVSWNVPTSGTTGGNRLFTGLVDINNDLYIGSGNIIALARNNPTYNTIKRDTTNGGILLTANSNTAFLKDNGNFLIGTTVDSGNGKLQLASSTANSGGLGFGADVSLYRAAAGTLSLMDYTSAATGVGGVLNLQGFTSGTSGLNNFAIIKGTKASGTVGGVFTVQTSDTSGNPQTALTLDSSQRVVVANATNNGSRFTMPNNTAIAWNNAANSGDGGSVYFDNTNALQLRTGSGASLALTLDSSQNATFAGKITAAGNINLANAFFLNGRNAANTADVPIVRVSASDVLSFGEGGYNATFAGEVLVNSTYSLGAAATGNQPYVQSEKTGKTLDLRGGVNGSRVLNNAGTAAVFNLTDGGDATFAGKVYIGNADTGLARISTATGALQISGNSIAYWDANSFSLWSGKALRLGNAYTAGAPTATGYVTIQDSAGNTYKVLVGT